MNLRSNEPMVDKHNEALLVLPTLFTKNGYSTLITDAPFVNYQWIADGDFFRSRGIGATNLQGTLSSRYIHDYFGEITALGPDTLLKRNFIIFSLMSAAPHRLREALYNDGRYWNSTLLTLNTHTLDSYAVLHYLPDLTSFTASGNTFTSITNDLTHEPSLLSWPDYTFTPGANESGTNVLGVSDHYDKYHCNAAALIMIGRWLTVLKEQGVYDKSRIIIVSDHGDKTDHPRLTPFQKKTMAPYNPLLLVKDFSSSGNLREDTSFMTNADVPYLAAHGAVKDIRNPLTGKELTQNTAIPHFLVPMDVTLHQGFSLVTVK